MSDTIPTSDDTDVVDVIRARHHAVRGLLDTIATAPADARQEPFERLIRLLAVHETAEEMTVYPSLRGGGDHAADAVQARIAEEDDAKRTLAGLERLDTASDEFEQRFLDFRLDVERHAEAEETWILPLLLEQHDAERRHQMARAFALAERMAPTHAHCLAPESATGNLLVGPFVAMVDKVRDAIRDARRD